MGTYKIESIKTLSSFTGLSLESVNKLLELPQFSKIVVKQGGSVLGANKNKFLTILSSPTIRIDLKLSTSGELHFILLERGIKVPDYDNFRKHLSDFSKKNKLKFINVTHKEGSKRTSRLFHMESSIVFLTKEYGVNKAPKVQQTKVDSDVNEASSSKIVTDPTTNVRKMNTVIKALIKHGSEINDLKEQVSNLTELVKKHMADNKNINEAYNHQFNNNIRLLENAKRNGFPFSETASKFIDDFSEKRVKYGDNVWYNSKQADFAYDLLKEAKLVTKEN